MKIDFRTAKAALQATIVVTAVLFASAVGAFASRAQEGPTDLMEGKRHRPSLSTPSDKLPWYLVLPAYALPIYFVLKFANREGGLVTLLNSKVTK